MAEKFKKILRALLTRRLILEVDKVPLPEFKLSYKRLFNWLLAETSVHLKPQRAWALPTFLQIEPTSLCNLRCKVCPVATGLNRPAGHMDYDLFCRLIDEVGGHTLVMMFWDWGEPLLNPRSFGMIRYAKKAGLKVVVSTNGHLLADADNAEKLVATKVDQVIFSVDGITQETYQVFRSKGRLDTVLKGVRQMVKQKRLQKAADLTVNLRFIVMKHNQHEIGGLHELARSLDVDVLSLRRFFSVPGQEEGEAFNPDAFMPDQAGHQIPPRLGEEREPVRVSHNPCRNLWNCPTIHQDGAVCSCFMDYAESRPLGNLAENSFREIWRGKAYQNLRRRFKKDWLNVELCAKCSNGYHLGELATEANSEVIFLKK
jgi:radical SAM protein with 4Fe4S-binding SPASM domain